MGYEDDMLDRPISIAKPEKKIPIQRVIINHPDQQHRRPGHSRESGRMEFVKEKEILIKDLKDKFAYRHKCGIIHYSKSKLSDEDQIKLDTTCTCHNVPKGHHFGVCPNGHATIVPPDTRFNEDECQACQNILNTPTPAEITQANTDNTASVIRRQAEKARYDAAKRKEIELEFAKNQLLALAITEALKPLFDDLKSELKK